MRERVITAARCADFLRDEQARAYDDRQRLAAFLGSNVHELSVCAALLEQVTALAAARQSPAIRRITIEVGALCGVDPMQLRSAFLVMRAGSCAADADLIIDALEIRIRCNTCDAVSTVAPNRLLCGQCGSYRSRVIQGDELRLRQVELTQKEVPCASTAAAH